MAYTAKAARGLPLWSKAGMSAKAGMSNTLKMVSGRAGVLQTAAPLRLALARAVTDQHRTDAVLRIPPTW